MSWVRRTRNSYTDAIDGVFRDRIDKFCKERREAKKKRREERKRKEAEEAVKSIERFKALKREWWLLYKYYCHTINGYCCFY